MRSWLGLLSSLSIANIYWEPPDERHWIKCGEADVIKPTWEADRMISIYAVDLMVYLVILDIIRFDNTWVSIMKLWLLGKMHKSLHVKS